MLIDIGVNLSSKRFDDDIEEVLQRALDAGVSQIVLTGTSIAESKAVVALCEQYNEQFPGMLYATCGIHPHDAKSYSTESCSALRQLARHKSVVAIGETGLDYNRNFSTPASQDKAFEAQLELAATLNMPVFMHERDAAKRQLEILASYRDELVDGVIHCFTGDKSTLFRYLDMDLHIGITGWICDERRGLELQKIVNNIPLQRLMIETDAPYLLPRNIEPLPKDRRNEPAFLTFVLRGIGACRDESIEEIAEATCATARTFFRLEENA
jgi:TatD DNase family protein